jgi:nucleoside-diphosphate-sugar epimerase
MIKHLLIVGAGDVALRAFPLLLPRYAVHAMFRHAARAEAWRVLGAKPFIADLDHLVPQALPEADVVLHSAPPGTSGDSDERTRALLAVLAQRPQPPKRIVYISTSGVYGDCRGERVDELRPLQPDSDRGRRRADAERQLQDWCAARGVALVILRAPGIYGPGRFPIARLKSGMPVLQTSDDVYTNHIHADDLAAICVRALEDDAPPGVYNASDDSEIRMGDWLDAVADRFALPRPPRIPRAEAEGRISPAMLSFMNESRRLINDRLKRELGYALAYPTVHDGLHAAQAERELAQYAQSLGGRR